MITPSWPSGSRETRTTAAACAVCGGVCPDAMAELTPRQRQMVDMQFQEELTVTEIARRLGVNKSTVSRCLRRARQRLYSRLRFTL